MGRYSRVCLWAVLAACLIGLDGCASNNSINSNLKLGLDAYKHGDYSEAQHDYEQALIDSRKSGDKIGEAASLNNLGMIAKAHGDYKQAKVYFERYLALQIASNNEDGQARALNNLGGTYALLEGNRSTPYLFLGSRPSWPQFWRAGHPRSREMNGYKHTEPVF